MLCKVLKIITAVEYLCSCRRYMVVIYGCVSCTAVYTTLCVCIYIYIYIYICVYICVYNLWYIRGILILSFLLLNISLVVYSQYMNEKYNFSPHGIKAKLDSFSISISFSAFITDFLALIAGFFSFQKPGENWFFGRTSTLFLIWKQSRKHSPLLFYFFLSWPALLQSFLNFLFWFLPLLSKKHVWLLIGKSPIQ